VVTPHWEGEKPNFEKLEIRVVGPQWSGLVMNVTNKILKKEMRVCHLRLGFKNRLLEYPLFEVVDHCERSHL
jgi:hypothetical protein